MHKRTLASTLILALLLALALPAAGASGPEGRPPPATSAGLPGGAAPGPGGLVVQRGETLDPLYWELKPPAPVASMDSVVQAALSGEELWVVGGYGSGGGALRYEVITETWSAYGAMPSPQIEYPVDGCHGLDDQGHEVIVLFPDATGSVVGEERVFDLTAGAWAVRPTPAGFPAEGLWAADIVSLVDYGEGNYCLISGGASTPGGGDQTGLWTYSPELNEAWFLGDFTHIPAGFDFHASWYVPWLGASGSLCVAGGVDSAGVVYADTQCYDLGAAVFNAPNADLGMLPQPWWGMADGWTVDLFQRRIWLADGADAAGALLQASAYYQEGSGGFAYGPPPAAARYRLEGDSLGGKYLHVVQGSSGGFTPSSDNQLLVEGTPEPCQGRAILRRGFDDWSKTGLWNLEYEADPCGSLAAPFPSSPQAAYYGDDTVCNYADGGANSGELTMPFDYDLTDALAATLQFSSYENTECGGNCGYDNRIVEASGDGGQTWTALGEGDKENAWYSPGFNLGAFLGGPVRVRFRFDTVDGYANEFFGWLVDDVTIAGCFALPEPETRIHLGDLQSRSQLDPFGRSVYIFKAQAHDYNHQPLADVHVTAQIFPPSGMPSWRDRMTKPSGWARFHWAFAQPGTWHFCISGMSKEGYVYWQEDNDVPICIDVTD